MVGHRIHRNADHLGVALFPFGGELRHGAEFGGADGGEIARVREDDGIAAAQPIVELDGAGGAFGGEIGGGVVDADGHGILRCVMGPVYALCPEKGTLPRARTPS